MEEWFYWNDAEHEPWFNMAIDELLLSQAPALGKVLVRTYRWDRPSVSFGSSQIYPEELKEHYTLVRRPTGGGVVYHDIDLTYTVIVPPLHPILKLDRMESYKVFHEALLKGMAQSGVAAELKQFCTENVDRSTMRCFVSPSRFDLVAPDGGKYAGAAQRRTRSGILHQGSILLSAAGGSWERLRSELLSSLAERFEVSFASWSPEAGLLEQAVRLGQEKYALDCWNVHHEQPGA